MSIIAACPGIMEPHGIRRRKWSRVMAVIAVCQGMMELRRIHRGKWSRITVVARLRQKVQVRRLKFDSGRNW